MADTNDGRASDGLKYGIFGFVFVLTMVVGCLPIWVLPFIERRASAAATSLACLSAFSGGVFLGVCLLDMIPDALDDYSDWSTLANVDSDFPWVLLGCCIGFLFVYFLDGLTSIFIERKRKSAERHFSISNAGSESGEIPIPTDQEKAELRGHRHNHHDVVGPLSLFFALLIHVTIEGFALGVQPQTQTFVTLFLGIAIHKALVIFSTGMKLLQAKKKTIYVVGLIFSLALFTTIGGVAGILLQNANLNEQAKTLMTMILTCFSAGTFIYITFFEILGQETGLIVERISAIAGFFVITIALYFLPS